MPIERTFRFTWRPLWQENLLLTSTVNLFGRGKLVGCIWSYQNNGNRLQNPAYEDTVITVITCAMGIFCLGDPMVDQHDLIIQSIQSVFPTTSSHTLLSSILCSAQWVWCLMAMMERVRSCTLGPRSTELRGALQGSN